SRLGPSGRWGVQESCLDVADQAQDQRPWVWANAMSISGFLDDRDFANQHPNRVFDRDRVQGRVVGVEDNHRRHCHTPVSWPRVPKPNDAVIGIMAGLVKASGYRTAACQSLDYSRIHVR